MICESVIDWAAIGAMLAGVGALLAGLSACWALFVAFPAWQRREYFKANAIDAREVLVAFYEGRQIIDHVRAPIIQATELAAAEKLLEGDISYASLPTERKRKFKKTAVLGARIDQHEEYWQRVYRLLPIARVLSADCEAALFEIINQRQRILASSSAYALEQGPEELHLLVMLRTGAADDPVNTVLLEAQGRLDAELSKFVGRH